MSWQNVGNKTTCSAVPKAGHSGTRQCSATCPECAEADVIVYCCKPITPDTLDHHTHQCPQCHGWWPIDNPVASDACKHNCKSGVAAAESPATHFAALALTTTAWHSENANFGVFIDTPLPWLWDCPKVVTLLTLFHNPWNSCVRLTFPLLNRQCILFDDNIENIEQVMRRGTANSSRLLVSVGRKSSQWIPEGWQNYEDLWDDPGSKMLIWVSWSSAVDAGSKMFIWLIQSMSL